MEEDNLYWSESTRIDYEKDKPHYASDTGWCRCICSECLPIGCSHESNSRDCKAHLRGFWRAK